MVIRGVPAVELDAGLAEASELNTEECVMAPERNEGARISSSTSWGGTTAHAALSAKLGELDCVVIRGVPALKLDAGVAESSDLNATDCVTTPE